MKELGLINPEVWQRGDLGSRITKTSMRGGPQWDRVCARITSDARTGEILKTEKATAITRNTEHALIVDGPRDISTTLLYERPETEKLGGQLPTIVKAVSHVTVRSRP